MFISFPAIVSEWIYWKRRDEQRGCAIGFGRDGAITDDVSQLTAIHAWHIENLLKFKAVFEPEIQRVLDNVNDVLSEKI